MKKQIVGQYVRSIRKRIGLKQHEVAKALGRDRSTIACYEIGRAMVPGDALLMIQKLELDYMVENGLSQKQSIPIL